MMAFSGLLAVGGRAMFPVRRDGALSARVFSPFATAEERVSPGLETHAISINAAVWRVGYVVVSLILLLFFQTSASAFSIGDRVQVANTGGTGLNVRNCAGTSCTKITNEPDGSKGTVIGGPTSANGFTWWDINWDNSFSGWSIQADSAGTYLLYIQPQLSVGPSSLNFGSVQVGSCTSATVSIQHIPGTSPTSGTVSAGPNPPFSITAGASFLLSGSSASNATVQFCPKSAGTFSGSSAVSASGAAFTTTSSVSLSGTGFVPVTTGAISVNATYNGQAWSGSVNYRLSGASTISGNTVPADFQNRTGGTYTLTFNSGGPSGSTLSSITPSATQTLNAGGGITFSFNFLSSQAPTVTAIAPTSGTALGGTSVAITGTNLIGATAVRFGGANALSFAVNSATSITATSPAGSPGVVDVTVTTAGGTSATGASDQFSYTPAASPCTTKIIDVPGLQAIQSNLSGNYCLGQTISANGATIAPIGTSTAPFTGTFDGQGYEISGLTINDTGIYVGLFAYLGAGGQISNLGLTNVSVTAPSGYDVGGLVGRNSGTISKSYTTGSVTGTAGNTNGLNGIAVGGVAGWNFGTITQSYSAASVGSPGTGADLGGISGGNDGTISLSYSTGSVSSIPVSNTDNFSLGGLVGRNKTGSITQSYAMGSITGGPNSVLGGLVATNDAGAGAVTNSYWDVQTTGQSTSVGGTGLTDAQLKSGLPSGFDPTVWGSSPNVNNEYPYLLWQKVGAASAPTVTAIAPTSGAALGSTSVAITGTNLTGATAVKFGGANALSFNVNSATSIIATSPAGSGVVDVTVTTTGGTSATSSSDQFTYIPAAGAPVITSVSPNPVPGSTQQQLFTIYGNNFVRGANVTLRDLTAVQTFPDRTPVTFSATQIAVRADFTTAADNWSVEVINPNGQSSGQFPFQVVAPPAPILSVTPPTGPLAAAGGTASFIVTNTGTGTLNYTAKVTSGSWMTIVAPNTGVNSGTVSVQYTANTGAERTGTVQVTATDPVGKAVTGSPAAFTVVQSASLSCTLAVNPSVIEPGKTSTLSWNSTNATQGTIDNGIGTVFPLGNTTITASKTQTYNGTFTNAAGSTKCQTTITVCAPKQSTPSKLVINICYDENSTMALTSQQRNEFEGAVKTAVTYYESAFTNKVVLNIAFGLKAGPSGGFTGTNDTMSYGNNIVGPNCQMCNYPGIFAALKKQDPLPGSDQDKAYNTLPADDPTNNANFDMTTAEAKALGFGSFTSTTNLDGAVWLNLAYLNQFTFSSNKRALPNMLDGIGILEHEISEVMGRLSSLGIGFSYLPLDLFRYTNSTPVPQRFIGNSSLSADPSAEGWFSINGTDNLRRYDNPQSKDPGTVGDFADWINDTQMDAFTGSPHYNEKKCVSQLDLREMNILGWQLASTALNVASQC
jgi:hypothetical protein